MVSVGGSYEAYWMSNKITHSKYIDIGEQPRNQKLYKFESNRKKLTVKENCIF